MSKPRLAITATVTDCDLWLEDWIAHHVQIFDQLFIWLDNPAELADVSGLRSDRVSILPGQQATSESKLTQILNRQDANADAALQLSALARMDWLVHLDADELFVPPDPALWDSPAEMFVFPNHECVPIWESQRPLQDVTRFKRNRVHPFMLYGNGKAAVRILPGRQVRAAGPHRFHGVEQTDSDAAIILHYACATYEIWWRKYARLGRFSDNWLDNAETPITLPFHLRSRDLVSAALETGDDTACRAFFESLMLDSETPDLLHVTRDPDGRVRPADQAKGG